MPGSPRQNSMFEKTRGYVQEGNPFPVTSCGRRRNDGSPLEKLRKTTKGKGRHFRKAKEGAGMTSAGVKAYRKANPGSKLKTAVTGKVKPGSKAAKRRKSYCSRSAGQMKMHNINCSKTPKKRICAARRRWKC
jgi:hypothetical protein